jgi:hypothetical protein
MRVLYLVVVMLIAAASPCVAQRPERSDLRRLLDASVTVEVSEGRFTSVSIDSISPTTVGAGLINGYRRMFAYLVQHQVPPERLYHQVATAPQPKAALIDNLLADSGATRSLGAYLASYAAKPGGEAVTPAWVSEAEVLTMAGRFFHAVQMGERSIGFYRCAGINGIQDLGAARRPIVEAFVFWGLAPAIFDADSASPSARALDADFVRAKASFRAAIERAGYAPAAFATAQTVLHQTMSTSPALLAILRRAYMAESARLPFRVTEWDR